MAAVRQMFDGYDTGVKVADDYAGRLLGQLADLGVDLDTAVLLSSDHGETLGELNVYGDHQTADAITTRVPVLLRWPGIETSVRSGLQYQIDITATLLELLDTKVPDRWHGESFARALRDGADSGRDALVVSQAAWACQRGVRFEDWMYIETRHDAYHLWPDTMLFDLASDPHQQHDLAATHPEVAARASRILRDWLAELLPGAARGRDPHENVMAEGGPFHIRGQLPQYLERLRETGREALATQLQHRWQNQKS